MKKIQQLIQIINKRKYKTNYNSTKILKYCTHNKYDIKGSPKLKVNAKGTT